ncbi:hypothetical protein TVNIR_1023 [Thioalkalivibrio nitratireducens DSM 14787]|uniref:EfeO-type cupredoxin-like domain-containing protein n=1 Tax=Thioalkalivibrio nitratireducens (strain DSM 14787 / UNIQEM 213 / ALEN2) TaxID=1255043 RepID=L0DUM6_THIND|nr:hypothetical protein [Thioalkalivibrio nitratireducens]AGA32707.1 hypothetical protein TVNIR_1023 [Thioalkalivibrio nitratireducens DSM 14787]
MYSKPILQFFALVVLALALGGTAAAGTPQTSNGITTIHLDQYNGYFAAQETLAGLKPGTYDFVVTNKAGKLVGFQIQSGRTHEQLDMFPLDPGETRTSRVTITDEGFRYRCPINPTPWYEVGVGG